MIGVYLLLVTMTLLLLYLSGLGKYLSQVWFSFFMNVMNPQYNEAVSHHKQKLFQHLQQNQSQQEMTILEIGCGPGGNLHLYPKGVHINLIAVEPNIHHKKYLENNLKKFDDITLQRFVVSKAENMVSIESNSLETVISTIVLCSVDDQAGVLREIKRVLKPGGKFYFMEHVVCEPGSWLRFFQSVLNGVWHVLFDGCNVTRDTASVIQNAGFADVQVNRFMASKLSVAFYPVYPHIWGYAVKGICEEE